MMLQVGETQYKKKKISSNGDGNEKDDIHMSYATMMNH